MDAIHIHKRTRMDKSPKVVKYYLYQLIDTAKQEFVTSIKQRDILSYQDSPNIVVPLLL
jgi:hypothetical protein